MSVRRLTVFLSTAAVLTAVCIGSLALPAFADTVTLGRRLTLIDHPAGSTVGRTACRAEGQLTVGDNLRGHIACEEYRGVKRLRDYYRLLKVWRGSWVTVARDDTDLVAQQTKATLDGSTPSVSICRVATGSRWYQVEHSTAVRWDNDTVTTKTMWSEKFQAPLLSNDPLCVPPSPAADIDLAFSHNPPSPLNGEAFTLVAAAGNNGDATANGVVFTTNLPDAWDVFGATFSTGSCTVAPGTNVVTCNLGALSAGEVEMISMQVSDANSVGTSAISGTLSSTTAGVASATATDSITVRAAADLALTKSATRVGVTNTFDFTFHVVNNGPNAATGVVVTDGWPDHLADPTTVPAGCTFSDTADTLTCNFGGVAVGALSAENLVVRAPALAAGTNTASVTGDQADPDGTNNQDSESVTFLP